MKKLAEKTRNVNVPFPSDLYQRLIKQTAKETSDRGRTITPSQIVRWAVEEYLDSWETATFVPDSGAAAAMSDEKGGA